MREVFAEWYGPDEATLQAFVTSGTIALDANVLLDLYRVGKAQRDEILSVLEQIGDRLFVPYQAAYEYQKNRLSTIRTAETNFAAIAQRIETEARKAIDLVRDTQVRADLLDAYGVAFETFTTAHTELRDSYDVNFVEWRDSDPVRDQLDKLLVGDKLGTPPSPETLAQRRAAAQKRHAAGTPPGLGDVGKKSDASGDYLVWQELLDYAESSSRPMLFVTNDTKPDDWYRTEAGQTVGPNPQLVAEMRSAAGQSYHQTTLSSFLRHAQEYLDSDIAQDTIEQVEILDDTEQDTAELVVDIPGQTGQRRLVVGDVTARDLRTTRDLLASAASNVNSQGLIDGLHDIALAHHLGSNKSLAESIARSVDNSALHESLGRLVSSLDLPGTQIVQDAVLANMGRHLFDPGVSPVAAAIGDGLRGETTGTKKQAPATASPKKSGAKAPSAKRRSAKK